MTSGGLYSPVLERVPSGGDIDHVTALLASPITVAVHCVFCAGRTDTRKGVTETAGRIVTAVDPAAVGSAMAGVALTVCEALVDVGAV